MRSAMLAPRALGQRGRTASVRGRVLRGDDLQPYPWGARLLGLVAIAVMMLSGCGKGEQEEPPKSRAEEERTVLALQSYVYASADESSFKVAERIRDQIKSAFGALRSLRVTGSNQGASNTAEEQLYKEPLMLVDEGGRERLVMRVWFRYTDEVIAPATLERGVPLLVGGLHRQDDAHFTQIVATCTANTAREREYKGRLQSVFDGALQGCQDAILAEQGVIDAARVRLDSPDEEVVPEEFLRVYIPVVARLLARKASQMGRFPRFEAVVPQAGRGVAVAAAPGGRPRRTGVPGADDAAGDVSDSPAAQDERPVAVAVGAAGPGRAGPNRDDEADPNAPPDPQADVPVIGVAPAAGAGKGAAAAVQPRPSDVESSFAWEDLLDKKFIVLWISLFGLYPLLKRRQ